MYKVCPEPVFSLTPFSISFSWLTQSFQGHLTFKRVQTHTRAHMHQIITGTVSGACQNCACSTRNVCPPHPVLLNRPGWSTAANVSIHGVSRMRRHTLVQHAAAFPAWELWLPSIIPPQCRVEWQLAAEEPPAVHSLARQCASLLPSEPKSMIYYGRGGWRARRLGPWRKLKDRWNM